MAAVVDVAAVVVAAAVGDGSCCCWECYDFDYDFSRLPSIVSLPHIVFSTYLCRTSFSLK